MRTLAVLLALATSDWMTGLPREPIHVKAWPDGKKVAICFVLYVEVWGAGNGPNFRPDTVTRKPDYLNESFRQYSISSGVPRAGRVFKDEGVPLSIALNAQFPEKAPNVWKEFRALLPRAPIVAHGLNNSTDLLPLQEGVNAQEDYVRRTLDIIRKDTGIRSRGWSSPSVYANADTFTATAAEGITYSLDAMDSDELSRLRTPSGPLILIPYPTISVDMGQYLARSKSARDMENLWTDYVDELSSEAAAHPELDATVVAIGIHPFVVGSPDGAAAMRRVLEHLKRKNNVWLTDVEAVVNAAGD